MTNEVRETRRRDAIVAVRRATRTGRVAVGAMLVSAVLAAGLAGGVAAQSESGTSRRSDIALRTAFDLTFDGGSAQAFLDLVVEKSGFTNIVAGDPEALASLTIPPVRLREVTLRTAFDVLQAFRLRTADGGSRVVQVAWISPGVTLTEVPSKSAGGANGAAIQGEASAACVVRVVDAPPAATAPEAMIVDLRRRGIATPDEARIAIDAMTRLVTGGTPSPTFRITRHDESGLIAVHGTQIERQLAAQVIELIARSGSGGGSGGAPADVAVNVAATAPPAADAAAIGVSPQMSEAAGLAAFAELRDVGSLDLNTISKAELQALLGKLSRTRQFPMMNAEQKEYLRQQFNRVLAAVKAR
jgi:hypothetical protein